MKKSFLTRWATASTVAVATIVALPSAPASAETDNSDVVISEIYVNGGSAGATYLNKFVELYNPTAEDIDVNGWSIQYRSAAGVAAFSGVTPLGDHHIEPGGRLLVGGNSNAANGATLPGPDVPGTTSFSGSAGTIALSKSTTPLTGVPAAVLADGNLVDLIGYGTSTTFEGAVKASGVSVTASLSRSAAGADSDNNSNDFTTGAPTPVACGPDCVGPGDGGGEPEEPTEATIAEIQGPGSTSPLAGHPVVTQGVVTAVYKTGGFSGIYLQTDGTGGAIDLATHTTSDGVFVFSSALAAAVDKGDLVEVTGDVTEFNGMTEITTSAGSFEELAGPAEGVEPAEVSFPLNAAAKESLEGMLLAPQGTYTITNNFQTNQYAEIGLAPGLKPFDTPTNVVDPGAPAIAKAAQNAADLVTLDDASSLNFLSAANQGTAIPWLTPTNEVRVGQTLTFDDPVVLDFRNNVWKLQPTEQLIAGGDAPVELGPGTRAATPKDVGGNVKIGTFNVLNYFPTTAEAYDAGPGVCTFYNDRAGNHITANQCGNPAASTGNGPRGAANDVSLGRQQAKIVKAINTLDADVVSLEEIENSIQFGADRDSALSTLVDALNDDAGSDRWAFVESPADLPDLAGQDMIRTAFIYQPAVVDVVGDSEILDVPAFANAREPLAQAFKLTDGDANTTFAVIVNHFKSKSSGTGVDADMGDGQGSSNASRVAQANALIDFADDFAESAGTAKVFLTGDFNAYNKEDPVVVLEEAGYVNVPEQLTEKETYQFDGAVGSLDHVFASPAAFAKVTDADIWNINSYESVAREYSRHNYNVTDFYNVDPYRASDHDPEIVGFDASPTESSVEATADDTTYGTAAKVDATITSDEDPDGGTVTVLDGANELGSATVADGQASINLPSDLAAGDHSLTVKYAGNGNAGASQTTVDLTVAKAATTTDADAPHSVRFGDAIEVEADVSAAHSVPTGVVTLRKGPSELDNGTVVDGKVSLEAGDLPIGTHSLQISYAGDANHTASNATVVVTVLKSNAGIEASVSPSSYGTSAVLHASGAPDAGGLVYVGNGDVVVGVGLMSNGSANISLDKTLAPGEYELDVYYGGNASYEPAETTVDLTVDRATTTTKKGTFTTKVVKNVTQAKVPFTVTAPGFTVAGGTVKVYKGSKLMGTGTVVNGKVTVKLAKFTMLGTNTLVAKYSGNTYGKPSQVTFSIKVVK